jgi:putative membrane protein
VALISSGLFGRLFGWFRLHFQTLSADSGKSGHQVAAPFARMEEVERVLAEAMPPDLPAEADYSGVSKRHILRHVLIWSLVGLPPLVSISLAWHPSAALLAFLPIVIGGAALHWRHHRYCVADRFIFIREGLLARRLWIIPYERLQAVRLDQGPLQRRLGLSNLALDTAGASAYRAPHIASLPYAKAEALAARLLIAHRIARERLRSPA